MLSRGCRYGALAVLAIGAVPAAAGAQAPSWRITAEVSTSRTSGGAEGVVDGDDIVIGPHDPTIYGIRMERQGERLGLGLGVRYAAPAFSFRGPSTTILDEALDFTLVEVAPELSMRLAGTDGGAALRASAGPVVDIWSWTVADAQVRLGARAGLRLDMPLGRGVGAIVGAALAATGSMFTEADVGPDLTPKTVWRREVGVGLRYALR